MYYSVGKRKTSIARVGITAGCGVIKVNTFLVGDYYDNKVYSLLIKKPLDLFGLSSDLNVFIKVRGGGTSSQVSAVQHAISKCLLLYVDKEDLNLNLTLVKSILKKNNFLTRDARKVERKKVGFRKARKKEQYSKR
jgi:small subunit ribosomal protein S9